MNEYIEITKKQISEYMKLVFEEQFNSKYCDIFTERYVNIRYLNYYENDLETTRRKVLEHLREVGEEIIINNIKDRELIELMRVFFYYVIYFDNVTYYKDLRKKIEQIGKVKIKRIGKSYSFIFSCKNIKMYGIYLLGILPAIGSLLLDIGGKSLGMYMALYLIGYYVLAEEVVVEKIVKNRVWNLIIMLAADILDVYLFIWAENANATLNTVMMYIALWFGILAIIGFGQKRFNFSNSVTRYLTSRSFQIYIIHFVWVVAFQFYFGKVTVNIWMLYIVPVVLSYIMTIVSCEIFERGNFILGRMLKRK